MHPLVIFNKFSFTKFCGCTKNIKIVLFIEIKHFGDILMSNTKEQKNKLQQFVKEHQKYFDISKIVLAFLFPVFICIFQCLRLNASLGDIYLADSQVNDDLFYFKQVESVLTHGIPQGYFGYNESHALLLSFGAWTLPMLLIWIVWGCIFGWTISSFYWCNLCFAAVALALFVYWAKPQWKQMALMFIPVALFPDCGKYLLSCMAETHLTSYLILFYGLAFHYKRTSKNGSIVAMFLISIFLTLQRPYFLLLTLLPGAFLFAKAKLKSIIFTLLSGIAGIAGYFVIAHYFTAAYFTPLFHSHIFERFYKESIYAGTRYVVYKFLDALELLFYYMKMSFVRGEFIGSNYCILLLLCVCCAAMIVYYLKKKEKNEALIYIHYLLTALCIFGAILLIYQKPKEGSRHIVAIIIVGMLLVSFIKHKIQLIQPLLLCSLIVYLFYCFPDDGVDYQIPVQTEERYAEQLAWEEIMQSLELTPNGPSYDNTVIWTLSDVVDDVYTYPDWQMLFALPPGFGISCCDYEYCFLNIGNLKCRYIMTDSNGVLSSRCYSAGYKPVGEYNGNILFQCY